MRRLLYSAGMLVLGIDPGTAIVGYGCIELPERDRGTGRSSRVRNQVSLRFSAGQAELVTAGVWRLGRGRSIEQRLLSLEASLSALLAELEPGCLAVEEAFYGKSVQSALRIGEARGVVLVAAARHGVVVAQYPPATIKLRVAGAGGASKQALGRMVGASLGDDLGRFPSDATDALAVALCHCWSVALDPNPGKRP